MSIFTRISKFFFSLFSENSSLFSANKKKQRVGFGYKR